MIMTKIILASLPAAFLAGVVVTLIGAVALGVLGGLVAP
jgi:hypothetical protein